MESQEVSVVGERLVPDKLGQDLADSGGAANGRVAREGLPPGYRMRADPHYVETLATRRAERLERLGQAAPPSEAAEGASHLRERRIDRVLAHVAAELRTIETATGLLSTDGSVLSGRLSVDLIRSQVWRAAWVIRAHALLERGQRAHLRSCPLGPVLEQLRQGFGPECRLAGIRLQVQAADWATPVLADEALLVTGVAGAVFATLSLIGEAEGSLIRISVDAVGGELRAVDVSQDEMPISVDVSQRFFEPAWADRPGDLAAGLGAAVARAAAQSHGGGATLLVGERRGTSIRLSLGRSH